jgi:phage gpG-like protein
MEIRDVEKKLLDVIRSITQSPAVKNALEMEAIQSIQRNFEQGGRPERWTPSKKKEGKTLIESGQLSQITAESESTTTGLIVTLRPGVNAKTYARIHQEGGTINRKARNYRFRQNASGRTVFAKNKHKRISKETTGAAYSISIPPRPYMIIPPEDFPLILNAVSRAINLRT